MGRDVSAPDPNPEPVDPKDSETADPMDRINRSQKRLLESLLFEPVTDQDFSPEVAKLQNIVQSQNAGMEKLAETHGWLLGLDQAIHELGNVADDMGSEFKRIRERVPSETTPMSEPLEELDEIIKDLKFSKEERNRRREERRDGLLLRTKLDHLAFEALVLKNLRDEVRVQVHVADGQTVVVWLLLQNTTTAVASRLNIVFPQSGRISVPKELIWNTAEKGLRTDFPLGHVAWIIESMYNYFHRKQSYEEKRDDQWDKFNIRVSLADYYAWWNDSGNHVIENAVAEFEKVGLELRKLVLKIARKQQHFGVELLSLDDTV